jgi:hypothetical protein
MSELCSAIGGIMGRPSWLPVPEFALQTLLGEGASVVLDGQCVLPARAQVRGGLEVRAGASWKKRCRCSTSGVLTSKYVCCHSRQGRFVMTCKGVAYGVAHILLDVPEPAYCSCCSSGLKLV